MTNLIKTVNAIRHVRLRSREEGAMPWHMSDLIETVNAIRNVPHSDLRSSARRVAVILTGPRSGSSLLQRVLSSHPDIASMDGEIQPFLTLTRNGFGYNSDSDAVGVLSNEDDLANNVLDGLTVRAEQSPPPGLLRSRWEKRLLLQFPLLFSGKRMHARLLQSLDDVLAETDVGLVEEEELQTRILSRVFEHEPWRIGYFDGHTSAGRDYFFNEPVKIEEPPFVVPKLYRKSFTHSDTGKVLLFKTPPDVYRIGMYEQLFPCAEVRYIHLTRGYAQSINGLMDGWLSPIGFFSWNMEQVGVHLNIKGYSDATPFGRKWWKFDLPPNWPEFTAAPLEELCLNQWISAHQAVLASGAPVLRIAFEDFLLEPSATAKKITDHLGLRPVRLRGAFPVVMATELPKRKRWRKRERLLLQIGERREVGEMMQSLGYEMNPETWL